VMTSEHLSQLWSPRTCRESLSYMLPAHKNYLRPAHVMTSEHTCVIPPVHTCHRFGRQGRAANPCFTSSLANKQQVLDPVKFDTELKCTAPACSPKKQRQTYHNEAGKMTRLWFQTNTHTHTLMQARTHTHTHTHTRCPGMLHKAYRI